MTTARIFRQNPSASSFFGAHALGARRGAAYVALLVLAYDRTHSAWIVSAVLAGELVPAIAFGPLFGALSDRHSPRACVVVADAIRCIAFAGLVLAHGGALRRSQSLTTGALTVPARCPSSTAWAIARS
jgi:MFS family permease